MTEYIVLNSDDTVAAKAETVAELRQKLTASSDKPELRPVFQRTGYAVLVQSVEILPDDETLSGPDRAT